MPYAQPVAGNSDVTVIYNVEQAVGPGAPNANGDVKLVQYLLLGIYRQTAANLVMDGYIGPITVGWITRFQTDMKKAGNTVLTDGRVDRAQAYQSSVSKTVYTIMLLNLYLKQHNPAAFANLPSAVVLSANPRQNPYNPEPEPVSSGVPIGGTVGGITGSLFGQGTAWTGKKKPIAVAPAGPGRYRIYYSDGSVLTLVVTGKIV